MLGGRLLLRGRLLPHLDRHLVIIGNVDPRRSGKACGDIEIIFPFDEGPWCNPAPRVAVTWIQGKANGEFLRSSVDFTDDLRLKIPSHPLARVVHAIHHHAGAAARNNCLGGANNHTGEVLPKGSERATQEHQ